MTYAETYAENCAFANRVMAGALKTSEMRPFIGPRGDSSPRQTAYDAYCRNAVQSFPTQIRLGKDGEHAVIGLTEEEGAVMAAWIETEEEGAVMAAWFEDAPRRKAEVERAEEERAARYAEVCSRYEAAILLDPSEAGKRAALAEFDREHEKLFG